MNNNIINTLNLQSEDIQIDKIEISSMTKMIFLSKTLSVEYCPICGNRMHSKGITKQKLNHPILQDGYKLILILNKRRWYCKNDNCKFFKMDEFSFALKYQHNTNLTPLLILDELKNPNLTMRDIANKFNVSDTYVHNVMLRYLSPKRLKLPKILSIDEVYLNIDSNNRYVLVLMDFESGEIIDLLPNRLKSTYDHYFLEIPKEERNAVEYLVCDMYNPYVNFTSTYFRNAKTIIDSFHVHQWLNHKINLHIIQVKKRYYKRDQKQLEEKNSSTNCFVKKTEQSREIYLLNNYSWFLLKNNIEYSTNRYWNKKLRMYLDTYDYEKMYMELDSLFPKIRKYKNLFIEFDNKFPMNKENALNELNQLITTYNNSNLSIFKEFAELLEKYKDQIINSFINYKIIPKNDSHENHIRRISNGPIESFNRLPKDLKRAARGYSNFQAIRTRILWINRPNEKILAVPKAEKEIHNYTNKTRGKYNK